MALHNLQHHHNFLSTQANLYLRSELFSDLVILTPDGQVTCHQFLLAPLSPLLGSLFSSYPTFPGLVHTVTVPVKLLTMKNILQIIYTGRISVRTENDMEDVQAGLQVLGIHLPGLECHRSSGHTYTARGSTQHSLDSSLSTLSKGVTENNSSVTPFIKMETGDVKEENVSLKSENLFQISEYFELDTKIETISPMKSEGLKEEADILKNPSENEESADNAPQTVKGSTENAENPGQNIFKNGSFFQATSVCNFQSKVCQTVIKHLKKKHFLRAILPTVECPECGKKSQRVFKGKHTCTHPTKTRQGNPAKTYRCSMCTVVYKNYQSLAKHKMIDHGMSGGEENPSSICRRCGKENKRVFQNRHSCTN